MQQKNFDVSPYPKAPIPPETTFMLATQREVTGDKQHEINMPNVMPTQKWQMQTIFHWLALGFALGLRWFTLGPRGFLANNVLVKVMLNHCFGGLNQHEAPTRMGLSYGGLWAIVFLIGQGYMRNPPYLDMAIFIEIYLKCTSTLRSHL